MDGFLYLHDDSNDAESIHRKCAIAVAHIDAGAGPALLHAKCFRYLEHVGINEDFDQGYRSRDEMTPWLARDSVTMQKDRLVAAGLRQDAEEIETTTDSRVEAAIAKAKASPLPAPGRLTVGVFHEAN